MVVFPLLLLLLVSFHGGTAFRGEDFRRVPMFKEWIFENMSPDDQEIAFSATLNELINGSDDCVDGNHVARAFGNIVKTPTDDEHLVLVRDYLKDGSFDKTGQLRYASVPVIEDQLVDDILDVIYSREEYVRLLNNPDENDMADVIKEMIRLPTQTILKQQLLHKILASRAWYEKFYNPMLENNKRQKLLNFARHLLDAHENGTLSTVDMEMFSKQLENVAFFDRPDDQEFRGTVDKLMNVFGASMNISVFGETSTSSPFTLASTASSFTSSADVNSSTPEDMDSYEIEALLEPTVKKAQKEHPLTTSTPKLSTSDGLTNEDDGRTLEMNLDDEHFPTGQPSNTASKDDVGGSTIASNETTSVVPPVTHRNLVGKQDRTTSLPITTSETLPPQDDDLDKLTTMSLKEKKEDQLTTSSKTPQPSPKSDDPLVRVWEGLEKLQNETDAANRYSTEEIATIMNRTDTPATTIKDTSILPTTVESFGPVTTPPSSKRNPTDGLTTVKSSKPPTTPTPPPLSSKTSSSQTSVKSSEPPTPEPLPVKKSHHRDTGVRFIPPKPMPGVAKKNTTLSTVTASIGNTTFVPTSIPNTTEEPLPYVRDYNDDKIATVKKDEKKRNDSGKNADNDVKPE